jgi:hypothetical protein
MNTKIAIDVDEVLVHLLKPMAKRRGVMNYLNNRSIVIFIGTFSIAQKKNRKKYYMSFIVQKSFAI